MDETPLTEAEMNQANYDEGFDSGVAHGKMQLAVAIIAIAKLWTVDPAIGHRRILDLCADFMHE